MKIVKTLWIGVSLLLLFAGCASKKLDNSHRADEQTVLIVWKTPSMRYADMGFVSEVDGKLKVEIYGSGSALMRLEVGSNAVCMSRFECMSKQEFNAKQLSAHYPPDTIEKIFKGEPLFANQNLVRDDRGFHQHIISETQYEIEYSVTDSQTLFRDTQNQILIKVNKQ